MPAAQTFPERGETHLWFGDGHGSVPDQDMELLTADERDRCTRFSRREDRQRFVAAWAAVRRAVAAYLDVSPSEIRFGRTGPTGFPGRESLRYRPLVLASSSARVFLSVARSEELWLLGLSVEDPIGVDLEHVRSFDTEGLIDRCLAPEEQQQVRALPPGLRSTALVRAWTRKEALMKAAGLPMTTAPHRVLVHPGRIGPVLVDLTDDCRVPAGSWTVQDLSLRGPVQAAFARPMTSTGPVLVIDTTVAGSLPAADCRSL